MLTQLFAQSFSDEELIRQISHLDNTMEMGYEIDVNAFSQEKIVNIFKAHYKQLELIEKLRGNELFKFNFFKGKGHSFRRVELHKLSNQFFQKALYFYFKLPKPRTQATIDKAFRTYGQMALNYMALDEKDSAYVNYKKAVIFSEKNIQRRILKASALNNLGMFCSEQLYQYDSAIYYLEKAQKEMGAITDEEF